METVRRQHRRHPSSRGLCKSVTRNSPGMSMYIKVRILIGVGDITPQEMTAPVEIPDKRRPSGEKLAIILRVWQTLVGVALVSNTL